MSAVPPQALPADLLGPSRLGQIGAIAIDPAAKDPELAVSKVLDRYRRETDGDGQPVDTV